MGETGTDADVGFFPLSAFLAATSQLLDTQSTNLSDM